jgi:hypothetical protein
MKGDLLFFLVWALFALATGFIWMAPATVAAWLLRPFHKRLFPVGHRIARSMRTERGTWAYNPDRLIALHGPSGLEVYVGTGGSHGVRVKTTAGHWEPHPIERRIIASAFNTLAREAARQAAEAHMRAEDDRDDRRLLTHEPGHIIPGLDEKR